MTHGLCGVVNPFSPCMINNKCTKYFPKMFNETTMVDADDFPVYQ